MSGALPAAYLFLRLKEFLTIWLTIVNLRGHPATGPQRPTSRKEVTSATHTKLCKSVLLAAVFALASSGATAQVPCGQRDSMVDWLAAKYQEVPIASGVTKGGLVEVLSTEDGYTWTIIVTSPKGDSCVIATGQGWRAQQHGADAAEPQA